jgi:CubicO group peptidase (beta-lactamase class C family)
MLAAGCGSAQGASIPEGPVPVSWGVVADVALARDVDELVRTFLEDSELPGISVALVREDVVAFSGGYGWADLEYERPMMAETPVLLSSVSKTFVGVAAMAAAQDGLLDLDEDIGSLAGFEVDNPRVDGDVLTLRHLLTHNGALKDSGVYDSSYGRGDPDMALGDFVQGYVSPESALYRTRNFATWEPGTRFCYSNVGMALAAFGVGEARGAVFSDLVADTILEPMGMVDSAYFLADLDLAPATPYAGGDGGRFRAVPQYGFPTYPDGLMRSSATDMGRYLAAMHTGSLDGVVILEPDALEAMFTVDLDAGTDEDGQAIAWSMRRMGGRELMGHNGGDTGSATEVWLDREASVGVVVLLNSEPQGRDWGRLMRLERQLLDLAD